jgi:uroporphyrin-III C-methyltransferase/precorrin-2 dehydrogenase/sirohydrochlorin ferrochelatase
MQYFPLFADLKGRDCLVVGGGVVALRRTRALLAAEARVTIIAPELTEELAAMAADGHIEHQARVFSDDPLTGYWLAVAATSDRALNARLAAAARRDKCWCNVVDDPDHCSFIMPTVIDHAPVTIAISSGGHSPVVARWIKGLIEAALPSRIGELAALAGRWRQRVREALPDIELRRRFWQSIVDGPEAAHALAGREAAAEQALEAALAAWHADSSHAAPQGEAWFVGAGPGDPELITLRGRRLLASADAVLYDRLVSPDLLAFARRDAEMICVGKTAGKPSIKQVQINRLLVRLLRAGKRVCRL